MAQAFRVGRLALSEHANTPFPTLAIDIQCPGYDALAELPRLPGDNRLHGIAAKPHGAKRGSIQGQDIGERINRTQNPLPEGDSEPGQQ